MKRGARSPNRASLSSKKLTEEVFDFDFCVVE
jgi:hypothetical protein